MKTAEEWWSKEVCGSRELLTTEWFIPLVKQIQLDAWRGGMKDAKRISGEHYSAALAEEEIEEAIKTPPSYLL